MSTFLQLCNDVERESGTVSSNARLTDVNAATGYQADIVAWVREAWKLIQVARTDWQWMIGEFEDALDTGKSRYSPADLGLERFSRWGTDIPADDYLPFTVFNPTLGRADENALAQIEYGTWRTLYDRGVQQRNRPVHYAISRTNEFCVGQVPDRAYTLRGEYRMSPQVLVANSDVPEMPKEFHHAIYLRALILLGEQDEAPLTIASAQNKYDNVMQQLVNDQTPRIRMG